MALSAVQIANMALGHIGQSKVIASLSEASKAAELCNANFRSTVETVLASFWWPFARGQQVLAEHATEERSGWAYAYVLPDDCLETRFLWTGIRNPRPNQRPPFSKVSDEAGEGELLVTDQSEAELVYTRTLEDREAWPVLFGVAVSWLLASQIGMPLNVKRELRLDAVEGYKAHLRLAAASAIKGEQADPAPDPEWITGRS